MLTTSGIARASTWQPTVLALESLESIRTFGAIQIEPQEAGFPAVAIPTLA